MTSMRALLADLHGHTAGSVLVETAIVAPALILMCIGGVEVGTMIEKQNRLQSVAEQATEIVMVSNPDTADERSDIREELDDALPATATVAVTDKYRCGTGAMTTSPGTCDEELLSSYIEVTMTDSYAPTWTQFGFGSAFSYNVVRTVQVS